MSLSNTMLQLFCLFYYYFIYDLILGDGMIKDNVVNSNKCSFLSASDNVLTRAYSER
jgi:hypothetical protein